MISTSYSQWCYLPLLMWLIRCWGAFHRELLFFLSTHWCSEASCQVLPSRKEKEIKLPSRKERNDEFVGICHNYTVYDNYLGEDLQSMHSVSPLTVDLAYSSNYYLVFFGDFQFLSFLTLINVTFINLNFVSKSYPFPVSSLFHFLLFFNCFTL